MHPHEASVAGCDYRRRRGGAARHRWACDAVSTAASPQQDCAAKRRLDPLRGLPGNQRPGFSASAATSIVPGSVRNLRYSKRWPMQDRISSLGRPAGKTLTSMRKSSCPKCSVRSRGWMFVFGSYPRWARLMWLGCPHVSRAARQTRSRVCHVLMLSVTSLRFDAWKKPPTTQPWLSCSPL